MDGIKKKINYDPALLYFSNKTDEEKPNPIPISTMETYNNTNRKHGCKICGKRFFTISSLSSHTEHHNLNEVESTNSKDDHWENRQTLKKGTQFVCSKFECNFVALDAVEFQKHTILCQGKRLIKDNAVAFCEHCENHFTSTTHLHAHTALTHSEGCPDISLNECRVKQIVSDPLCLYVSENTDGENSSRNPTMYPGPDHPSFSKKRVREAEFDDPSNTNEKKTSQGDDNGNNEVANDVHETITNGIHCLNDNARMENSASDGFYSTKESDSCENNFENSETVTFNCGLLAENINIEIIVVQPSAEETSIEPSGISDETILCVNDPTNSHGNIETANTLNKPAENDTSSGSILSLSKQTNENPSQKLENDENQKNVRNTGGCFVNNSSTAENKEKKLDKISASDGNANEPKEEMRINSQSKTDKNSIATSNSNEGSKVLEKTVENLRKKSKNHPPMEEAAQDLNEKLQNDFATETIETLQKHQNPTENPKEVSLSRTEDNLRKDSRKSETEQVASLKSVKSPAKKLIRNVSYETNMNSKKDEDPSSKEESSRDFQSINKTTKLTAGVEVEQPIKEFTLHCDLKAPIQNLFESESNTPTVADKSIKKRQKRAHSELFVSSNVKERSIRSRKKLILPDFEYALDSKFEKDDSAEQSSTSTSKNKSLMEKSNTESESPNSADKIVRKRGRPRKSIGPTITTAPSFTPSTEPSSKISEKTATAVSTSELTAKVDEKITVMVTSTTKSTLAIDDEAESVVSVERSAQSVDKMKIPDTSAEETVINVENAKPTASTSKTNIDVKALPITPVANKSLTDINDDTEIFSLTTTMSETDHDISLSSKNEDDGLRSDADESWLKRLDFSEGQSLTDSWGHITENNEPPKKKLGRPPKRKKVKSVTATKNSTPTNDSKEGLSRVLKNNEDLPKLQQSEPKKRGRPRKVPLTSIDDVSLLDVSGKDVTSVCEDSFKKLETGNNQEKPKKLGKDIVKFHQPNEPSRNENNKMKHVDAILNSVVTIKRRGRPPKQKPKILTQSESNNSTLVVATSKNEVISEKELEQASSSVPIRSENVSNPTINNIEENMPIEDKNEKNEALKIVKKKRGRPKKSLITEESKNLENTPAIENEVEADPELEKSVELTVEDINIKKKREFMEYIRIKEDVDDSDHKPGKKVDNTHTSISPPKKRGRPRLDEVARKRAAAAESAKTDRPYSIYNKYSAVSDLKRRRNPLQTLDLLKIKKNKRRKLLDDAKCSENTSASETANDSSTFLSDSSTADDGATLNDDDLPYVVKKFGQKRVKKLSKVKAKKSRDVSPTTDDAKQDETKNIDPELYSADMKNRAKYSRVFRKVQEVPKHDEYFPNSLVTCGRCKKLMTLRHYHLYHQISHYFLCWLDGEKELDFTIDTDLIKIMQQYVNPDALRKKLIKLHCEQCHKIMKSVVGYVSHIRFCSKMNEEEFLGTCVLCGKKLKPSSLRHHYVKTHNISLPNVNAKSRDELFLPAPESLPKSDSAPTTSSTSLTRKVQKSYPNFERKVIDKSDIINDEKFWTTVKTSYDLYMCMGLGCKHMTLSKDDLKNHILNCHTAFCEFKCLICPFITRYESEIIYHTKNSCKDFSDSEDKVDDEVDKSITEGRRVSNRVKKRKYRYDDEFFDDNESKKMKGDDDFRMSNEDEEDEADFMDDTDYDSDEQLRTKSRPSKRKSGLYSAHGSDSSLRIAFLNHDSTRQYDPLNWTVETRQKICNVSPILEELKVNSSAWGLTSILNLSEHVPKQVKSMKVASDNNTFVDYKLFQSEVIKGVPICFVGGPVWALAWAPLPAHISEQYLAVAGLQHMNHLIELSSSVEFPSLIQIWKYGSLDNISNAIDNPILDVAIAHKYGAVSCMEWCPSGGFDNRPNTSRLGILAVATSAGCVVVYSVPKLDASDDPSNRVACVEPDLILRVAYDNVQCTRVVWLRKKEQGVICGGFSNGTIALWNISSKSSLLRDGNKVYPYRTFEAHNASILALDAHWLDNGRYLLTSSIDRVMKYWDLEDLSGPLNEQEGSSPIVNVVWLQQWAVSAVGIDSSNVVDASAVLSHSRDTIEKKKSISSLRDTCWSIAYSDWNDTVALSLCSGQVSVFAAKHMSTLTFKQPDFEKVVTETSLIPLNDDDKESQEKESIEELTGLPETKSSYDCTSVLQEFGLQFCDRVKNKTPSTKSGFTPDCCNVMSINKVCWNQNYNSFNWLAVGYESGFVRVFRVERFDKLHLTKFYKMNENSNVNSI